MWCSSHHWNQGQTFADGIQAVNLVRQMILKLPQVLSERRISIDEGDAKKAVLFCELVSCEEAFQQFAIEGIPPVVFLPYFSQVFSGWDVLLPNVLTSLNSFGDAGLRVFPSDCQFRQWFRYGCARFASH